MDGRIFGQAHRGPGPGRAANVKETLSIKRWPSARYQALIRRLLDETDFNLLLIGGPTDREAHEAMAPDTARILDGAGVLSLQQSYLALKKMPGDGDP